MPGPGGPGPAAQRVLAQRLDPRLVEPQVLIVEFPGSQPEVYIACADPARCALHFSEASVSNGDNVEVGSDRFLSLTDIGAVQTTDSIVQLLTAEDGHVLANIHFEDAEAHRTWAEGLRAFLGDSSTVDVAGGGDADSEMSALQAKSRHLQSKISGLEALNERRDSQLHKMVRRLDGAMQMLSAVQDMCKQQGSVIQAQKVAIGALQGDLGIDGDVDAGDRARSPETRPQASPKASANAASMDSDDSPDGDGQDGEEEGGEADEQKLTALLAQANQMQQMLEALEGQTKGSGAEVVSESSGSPAGSRKPPISPSADAGPPADPPGDIMSMLAALMGGGGAGGLGSDPSALAALLGSLEGMGGGAPDEEDEGEDEDEDELQGDDSEEAALARLQGLEAQKEHFEGLLRDSQQEHLDLQSKLASMRQLMSSLGLEEEGGEN